MGRAASLALPAPANEAKLDTGRTRLPPPDGAPALRLPETRHISHLRRHRRFYAAALLGIAVELLAPGLGLATRSALSGATFFVVYLATTAIAARRLSVEDLRGRATSEDEGILVIVVITLAAITLSLGSLLAALAAQGLAPWHLIVAIANVPLGWATLHTVMAFHYAHLFYAPQDEGGDSGGMDFPGTDEPTLADFLYYSFVVGMTAQVADVATTRPATRRATLAHGVVSFFFNTVILALAVNVAAAQR